MHLYIVVGGKPTDAKQFTYSCILERKEEPQQGLNTGWHIPWSSSAQPVEAAMITQIWKTDSAKRNSQLPPPGYFDRVAVPS